MGGAAEIAILSASAAGKSANFCWRDGRGIAMGNMGQVCCVTFA